MTSTSHATRRKVLLASGAVVLLLVGGYLALAAYAGERIPRGTEVRGVAIGGLDVDGATQRLEEELGTRAREPIPVRAADVRTLVNPREAGLRFDAEATVESVHAPFSLNPVRVFEVVFGGGDVEPVIRTDDERLSRAVDALADDVGQEPRDGAVSFSDGTAWATQPRKGVALDRVGSMERIQAAFLGPEEDGEAVPLPTEVTVPTIDAAEVERAMTTFAEPAMSGPVEVRVGDNSTELTPRQVSEALTMVAEDGDLVPRLEARKLVSVAGDELAKVETEPRDATVRLASGQPEVVPGRPGRTVAPARLGRAVLAALPKEGPKRVAKVKAKRTPPDRTTAEARELEITEVVGEFSTEYPHADYRNVNIGRAAELIDGTLLEPGETFSLNDIVGERTVANGFTTGYIIEGGRLREGLGGGVSQLATTVYNAAFYAGLEDVEHRPHAFWISRYPMGREATVYWGYIDLRFRNNTPYGVLVDAFVDQSSPGTTGQVTVRLWSTDYWDVEDDLSGPYNERAPETIYDPESGCVDQAGSAGFDVDVTRRLYRDGELVDTQVDTVSYRAEDRIVCSPPPE